jgi:hypothetical protein
LNADPDPATQINADPCGSGYGSGSETLFLIFNVLLNNYDRAHVVLLWEEGKKIKFMIPDRFNKLLEHGEGIHHVEAKRNVLEIVLAPSWLHETPVDCPELIKLVILQAYTIA